MPFLRSFAWAALMLGCLPLSALAATSQTITFPTIAVRETNAASFALTATASSGLPVSYEVVGGASVVSVSGSTVTLSGQAGAYAIRATQAGNGTYDAAAPVTVTSSVRSGAGFQTLLSGVQPFHAGGIKTDGTLWMWGGGTVGQLGDGNNTSQPAPIQIGTATDWQSGALGANFTLVIKTDGTLWGFGANSTNGLLGVGNTTFLYSTPVRIGTATDWKMVAAGSSHSAGVRQDGSLWTWGLNTNGQLGQGTTTGSQTSPVRVGTGNDWAAVGCGANHVVALKTDGTLWAWGQNTAGQLGDGTTTSHSSPAQIGTDTDWKTLRVGRNQALAIKTNGSLWGWGQNAWGNLGLGTTTNATVPAQVGTDTNWSSVAVCFAAMLAVRADGTLWAAGAGLTDSIGDGTFAQRTSLVQIGTDTDWLQVGASLSRYALKTDGSLWTWGSGNSAAGTGLTPRALQPAAPALGAVRSASSGLFHTLAVRADGTLWSWGSSNQSQLGTGTYRKVPLQVGTAANWAMVAAGQNHSLAVKTDGTLWGFGANNDGQLGDGTTSQRFSPVQCGTATNWQTVVTGSGHSLGLRTDGTLWAWGDNNNGRLGDTTTTDRPTPIQIGSATWSTIAVGGTHSLGVRTNGTLWAWGLGLSGQIGNGSTSSQFAPTQVGSETTWTKVACGENHSVALKADGTLWTWGSNNGGQLGDGTTTQRNAPVQVGTDTDWTAIAAGATHTVALKSNGTLWSWGNNDNGQLGDGTAVGRRTVPAQAGTFSQWKALGTTTGNAICTLAFTQGDILCAAGDNGNGMLAEAAYDQTVPQRALPAATSQGMTFPTVISPAVGAAVTLAATTTSGLPASYVVSGPATLTGSTLTRTGIGAIRVAAYGAADASWQPAPLAMQTLLSSDASLSALTPGSATLAPPFAPATLVYAATVPNGTTTLLVTATAAYAGATVSVNSQPYTTGVGSATVPLAVGVNTIPVQVLAEDQTTARSYILTLTRQTAYQTWAATNLGDAGASMTADADADGQTNLLEYAFNTAPQTAGSSPVLHDTATVGPDKFLRLTVPKNPGAPELTFTVQATSTLEAPASWSSAGLVIESDTSTQLVVRDNAPVGAGVRRFMRVRVEQVQ